MENGFTSWKDILEVVIIPVSLALLAVIYPYLQSRYRRYQFQRLIRRELREIGPYPKQAQKGKTWVDHQTKRCLHEEILANPTDNRDFILSLDPDITYHLTNLWASRDPKRPNPQQWIYCLSQLDKAFRGNGLDAVMSEWCNLMAMYQIPLAKECKKLIKGDQ